MKREKSNPGASTEQRRTVAYLDGLPLAGIYEVSGSTNCLSRRSLPGRVAGGVAPSAPLRGCLSLRFTSGTMPRDALLPSVLDRTFKPLQGASRGEL